MPKTQAPIPPEPQRSLEYMTDEDEWGIWPVLPVKRRVDGQLEYGVMLAAEGPKVWLCIEYPTHEALVADGWRVD